VLALLAALAFAPRALADDFRSAPDLPFAIDHLALDLDVDLQGKSVSGTATFDLHAVRDLTSLQFDAFGLEVAGASLLPPNGQKGEAAETSFANDGEHLDVACRLKRGDKSKVKVRYSVHDPKAGLHFFSPTTKDPTVPLEVYSQGEARFNHYWFPCVDAPCWKQTTELTAHVPAGFEALSNGSLESKKDEGGKTVFHWVQDKPHVAYLVTLAVGKFFVGKDEWRGKPLLFYVPEKNKDDVGRSFGETKDMIEFFSQKIGVDYAWAKYAQVVVEQFGWGGMENTSATTLNDYTLHDARAHLDFESDGLVSHELAHQWWGDLLTCRDWAHIWLNEGFASYFEALWDEHKNGAQAFEYNMFEKGQRARSEICKQRPIVDHFYNDPENVFDDRNYPKGSWVLHGLRRRVGDEAFWKAINRYAKAHLYGNVETIDLRRAFEEETGESLERYFRDLTDRPGHPTIEVNFDWHEQEKLLEAWIRETQPGEAFAFKSEIQFGGPTADLVSVPVSFENEKEKRLLIPLASRPTLVRFDPREAVLKELTEHKGEDQWLFQLAHDPQAVGRIRAAHALADMRAPHLVAAVAKQLKEDKEWFVSVECARALGRAGGDVARDGLLAGLGHANPKVRRAAAEALGAWHRDDKVIAALRPIVEKGDASYYVEA
jgi:aminopeptidase N